MTTLLDLTSIIASATVQRELQPRNDLREPGWTFWELRTLNMHRVVGLLHEHREFLDAHDFEATIRRVVSRNFKTSWWRGMGYGIVAEVAVSSLRDNDLKVLVDGRENSKGTLQWVVLVARDARVAVGVHTWMETYLSPVYRNTLQALAQLSQPEGQGTGKVNKNNVRSQKVSTTIALPSLVYHMTLVGDSGWRLRRQAEVQLF